MKIEELIQDEIAKKSEASALEGVGKVGPQKALLVATMLALKANQKFYSRVKNAAEQNEGRLELTDAAINDFNSAVMANGLLQDVAKLAVALDDGLGSVGVEPGTKFN